VNHSEVDRVSSARLQTAVMSDNSAVEGFWRSFVAATGVDGTYTAWAFGNDAEMADSLGRLVRDGPKRATTSLLSSYQDDDEPLPKVGDMVVVLGGRGEPICVIRTVSVDVRPFGQVDERFAWIEGEGDRSLEYWRAEHDRFFKSEGRPVDDDTAVVLETFELLWSPNSQRA
jgi:uncharacterized protein YhfF